MATGSGGGSGQDIGGIFVSLGIDTAPFKNDIERARAATELMDAELERLKQQAASGAIPLAELAARSRELQQAMKAVESAMNAAGVQTAAQTEKAARAAESKADRETRAAERSARAAELKADREAKAEQRSLQAALQAMDQKSAAAQQAAADASRSGLASGMAGFRGVGATASFASYAAETEEATRATLALTAAQDRAKSSATAAFASYASVGQKVADVSKSVAGIADKKVTDLILKVQGQTEADGLRGKISDLRQQMIALGPNVSANDPRLQALGAQMKTAADRVDVLDKQFGRARGGMAGFGQAGLQAGRILQDFTQGGIGGILNNLEGMTMALGGGAGLAGLLTAVGVAAFIAKPFFADLFKTDKVDPFKTSVERLADRIKELTDNKDKSIVDRIELAAATEDMNRLVKAAEAYNEARGFKNKAERASETAVSEAVGEDKGAAEALRKSIAREQEANDPGLKAKRTEIEKLKADIAEREEIAADRTNDIGMRNRASEMAAGMKRTLQQKEMEAQALIDNIYKVGETAETSGSAQREAGRLLRKALPGEDVAERNEALARGFEGAGKGALASQIRGLSPKDFKEQAESDENAAAISKRARDREAAEKKAMDAARDAIKNRVGPGRPEEVEIDRLTKKQDYEDAQDDFMAAKRANAADKKADRADETAAKRAEAAKLRLMTPAQRKAYQRQRDRALIDGRVGPEGGVGAASDVPSLPAAPGAAGAGDVSLLQKFDVLIGLTEKLVGNTDELDMGATFG